MKLYKVIEYPVAYRSNLRKGSIAYYKQGIHMLCKLYYPMSDYEVLRENI